MSRFNADGMADVETAASDMGPRTYTSMTQVAADALGLPVSAIRLRLGRSDFQPTPPHGGSQTMASVGPAVQAACLAAREKPGVFVEATNPDIASLDAIFIDETDPHVNPLGAKGLGELAYVGAGRRKCRVSRDWAARARPADPRRRSALTRHFDSVARPYFAGTSLILAPPFAMGMTQSGVAISAEP
jgi:hypothetical protein